MILIDELTDILEQARILQQKVEYIDYVVKTDESNLALVHLNALLGTDATSHNIECITEYVNEHKDSIDEYHAAICYLVDSGVE